MTIFSSHLEHIEVHNQKECAYPPILDKDPILAANFLTIEDSGKCLEIMLSAFEGLKKGERTYPLIEYCILWSFTNFNWFVSFTKELIKLIAEDKKYSFPIELCPEYDEKKDKKGITEFFPPTKYAKKRAHPVKFRNKIKDSIDMYRILYIASNYYLEDFRGGFPAWYSIGDLVVYESYNAKTNVRIRVIHRDKEFRYFICGASDNWKEIMEVPLEMDYIVTALLFRDLGQ